MPEAAPWMSTGMKASSCAASPRSAACSSRACAPAGVRAIWNAICKASISRNSCAASQPSHIFQYFNITANTRDTLRGCKLAAGLQGTGTGLRCRQQNEVHLGEAAAQAADAVRQPRLHLLPGQRADVPRADHRHTTQ